MAIWTGPKTWSTGETLTASDMNVYVRDNQEALKDPPTDNYEVNEGADYTTASNSFVDVDATNLKLTITTGGGAVMIVFFGMFSLAAVTNSILLNVTKDGVVIALEDGIQGAQLVNASQRVPISFSYLLTGLAVDTYEFRLQWKVSGSTATLYAGAGTANADVHPQFWVREV